jgi:hypothetical protein
VSRSIEHKKESVANQKPRAGEAFDLWDSGEKFFFPPIIRIPRLEGKTANFFGVSWVVSGLECGVVTSDFGVGG